MKETPTSISKKEKVSLYERIRQILESARTNIARTVNTTQVVANWLIGREIVEEEQRGERRAVYGEQMIAELSEKLQKDFGIGYGTTNLKLFRQFFLAYPAFLKGRIGHTLSDQSLAAGQKRSPYYPCLSNEIGHTPCDQLWEPGLLHPNLSWSLYRHLVRLNRQMPEPSTRSRPSKTTGQRGNWNDRSTVCCMNGWP